MWQKNRLMANDDAMKEVDLISMPKKTFSQTCF